MRRCSGADELAEEDGVPEQALARAREDFEMRAAQLRDEVASDEGDAPDAELHAAALDIRRQLLEAERECLTELAERREVTGDTFRDMERDLDLEQARLEERAADIAPARGPSIGSAGPPVIHSLVSAFDGRALNLRAPHHLRHVDPGGHRLGRGVRQGLARGPRHRGDRHIPQRPPRAGRDRRCPKRADRGPARPPRRGARPPRAVRAARGGRPADRAAAPTT